MARRGEGATGARRHWKQYRRLSKLAETGDRARAEAGLRQLLAQPLLPKQLIALCHNDLAVVAALRGAESESRQHLESALSADPECQAALANRERLPQPAGAEGGANASPPRPPRVAIVSLLFNWQLSSAGGGCVHTLGVGEALAGAGCEVKHFYARCPEAAVGRVEAPYPLAGEAIDFDRGSWRRDIITHRFRAAVERFAPDLVIVTDAWRFKPHLAEAMQGWPIWLRFDSQECLCPLNNCRFLVDSDGLVRQCPYHQLARPEVCRECLDRRGQASGPFHRMERELSGVTDPGYMEVLQRSLEAARAVLVVNPLVKEMISPCAGEVHVVPPGVDAGRFPPELAAPREMRKRPYTIFMAGVVEEPFKGFNVLHHACQMLWQRRRDFRLVATGQAAGRVDEFTEFTGWIPQHRLPQYYSEADICVVPSLVQEGWPIVAVEGMAAGRPVVASRIGGLQFLVRDGATGLLSTPGDGAELCARLDDLLSDRERRRALGRGGREWFEQEGSWERVILRYYRSLLTDLGPAAGGRDSSERGRAQKQCALTLDI
jgi:glycosyltransferase involved in cell wall biosynthesis